VQTVVVVPTYQESENIVRFLGAVRSAVPTAYILVVDDDSPDGTGKLADGAAAELGNIVVMHRVDKKGLGSAYRDGFAHVLAGEVLDGACDVVVSMDCDFSHDPAAIPALLASAQAGADLVLGSRYCEGGRVENWGRVRRLISSSGCLYARTLLGVRVRDLTGGFKCFRREVLQAIPLEQVRSNGYAFQVEMSFRAWKKGFRLVELPIVFVDRVEGQSKMNQRIVREAVWMVWWLRFQALFGRLG